MERSAKGRGTNPGRKGKAVRGAGGQPGKADVQLPGKNPMPEDLENLLQLAQAAAFVGEPEDRFPDVEEIARAWAGLEPEARAAMRLSVKAAAFTLRDEGRYAYATALERIVDPPAP